MKRWQGTVLTLAVVVCLAAALVSAGISLREQRQVEVIVPGVSSQAQYGALHEETITLSGTGTGGAVSASGSTGNPIRGHVWGVHLDYAATISDTTDLTLTLSSPALTVLQLTDYYTDTWYYPAVEQTGSDGSGLSAYDRLPVSGYLEATVGETISGTICTVTVWWGE